MSYIKELIEEGTGELCKVNISNIILSLMKQIIKGLPVFRTITGVLILLMALCVGPVDAGPYIDSSAHGNSSYGVKRSATYFPAEYTKGHCAHCHEQHASFGGNEPDPAGGPDNYSLFDTNHVSQTENFCFNCHGGSYQTPLFNNYSYSYRAGGDTSITCPNTILSAFSFIDESGNSVSNCSSSVGSSHKLTDIKTFITGKSWGYTSDSNPCNGCHNPHSAQRDPHTSVSRGWPVSRPSLHNSKDNNAWGLYGDDASERMDKYSYQAPLRKDSNYEPDESATQDGSNLTDFVTFCTDCHINVTNSVYSNKLDRYLEPIDWSSTGDKHGGRNRGENGDTYDKGLLKAPYSDASAYVLSCLDCHEPHGSKNAYLLRSEVNGVTISNPISAADNANGSWNEFCAACHDVTDTGSGSACTDGLHGPPFATSLCTDCHRHNSGLCPRTAGINETF